MPRLLNATNENWYKFFAPLLPKETNRVFGNTKVAAQGRSSSAHSRPGTFCGRLLAAESSLPPGASSVVHQGAGPVGEDGVTAGPEARAAAGQRPRRPSRLSTNFLQVRRPEPCCWPLDRTCAARVLGKRRGLGSLGINRSCVQGQPAQAVPFLPGGPKLVQGCPRGSPKGSFRDSYDMEARASRLHPCPASCRVMNVATHSLCDLGIVFSLHCPSVSAFVQQSIVLGDCNGSC